MKEQNNRLLSLFARKKVGYWYFSRVWNSKLYKHSADWIIIALALVPLILVQQVSRSMIEGITERIIETDSYHLLFQAYDQGYLSDERERNTIVERMRHIEGVESTYAEVRGLGIIRKGTKKSGISIRGVPNTMLQEDEGLRDYLVLLDGVLEFTDSKQVILGKAVAERLEAEVGDQILVLTTRSEDLKALPKISRNIVIGIVSTGYEELDRSWVLTSTERATEMLSPTELDWYIGIKIADPFILANELVYRSKSQQEEGLRITARIESTIFQEGSLYTWYSLNYNRFSLFKDTRRILSLVMMIAVLLSAVTLSSTMSMKVIDMETDIAMLKGIGASPRKLEGQVFLQGLRYGIIGSVIGSIIGILLVAQINTIINTIDFCVNVLRRVFGFENPISILNPQYYLTEIPFRLYFLDIAWIIVFTVVLSVLAAWLPVRNLRKISALKTIRRH